MRTASAYVTRFASAAAFASPSGVPALARIHAGRSCAPAFSMAAAVSVMYCRVRA